MNQQLTWNPWQVIMSEVDVCYFDKHFLRLETRYLTGVLLVCVCVLAFVNATHLNQKETQHDKNLERNRICRRGKTGGGVD